MRHSFSIWSCLFIAFASVPAHADYKSCVTDQVKASIKEKPCDVSSALGAIEAGQLSCRMGLAMEAMNDKSVKVGSPESTQMIDNKKRAAYGDSQDLIMSEAKRCHIDAQIQGNTITVTHSSSGISQ